MLRPIETEALIQVMRGFSGRRVYLHVEVTPGTFLRNLTTDIEEVVLRDDNGSYRLALRSAGDGWVVMEGLTHMSMGEGAPLHLCTLVEEDRLTRVIQISEEAFAA